MYYTLFLKHPLVACTQVYMEVLDNIAVCKRELGDVSAAEYYTALCVNCVNEFGIDFSKVNLFMY